MEEEGRKDFGHLEVIQFSHHNMVFINLVNSLEDSVKRSADTESNSEDTRSNSEDSVKRSEDTESR